MEQGGPPGPPVRASDAEREAVVRALTEAAGEGRLTLEELGERTDRDALAATRADQERSLADVAGRQDRADETLESNRSRESTLTATHDLLTQCVEAAKGYFDLPAEQSPESSRLFRVMYDICPQI